MQSAETGDLIRLNFKGGATDEEDHRGRLLEVTEVLAVGGRRCKLDPPALGAP